MLMDFAVCLICTHSSAGPKAVLEMPPPSQTASFRTDKNEKVRLKSFHSLLMTSLGVNRGVGEYGLEG